MECLLPYLCMVTVPHIMVGLERMLDYRGVGLVKFHCTCLGVWVCFIGVNCTNSSVTVPIGTLLSLPPLRCKCISV